MNVTSVKNPAWANAEHTAVNLAVDFEEIEDAFIPVQATADYDMAYGRDLFASAIAGAYGPIAAYVAPVPTAEQLRATAKQERASAVAAIVVTTSTGKTFDGDETSQTRMARAIIGMQAASVGTINWTLANNQSVSVTVAELTEALILAGQEQAALWPIS